MTMRVSLQGIDQCIAALQQSLDEEVQQAALDGAGALADVARTSHRFVNRTGLLHSRLVPGRVTGKFLRGTLVVRVLGDTFYGNYLEEGTDAIEAKRGDRLYWAFLGPAWKLGGEEFERKIQEGITRGVALAGMGG